MTIATALTTGPEPLPQLAEAAIAAALARAGLKQASGVLLLMTPDFARHAAPAVLAVARRAQCTEVAGAIAAGVLTEDGSALDRPAVAVMAWGEGLRRPPDALPAPLLSYAAGIFPADWREGAPRLGATLAGAFAPGASRGVVWQHGRIADRCSVPLPGGTVALAVSTGLRILAGAERIDACVGFDLRAIGGKSAAESLSAVVPGTLADYCGEERRSRPRGPRRPALTRLVALVALVGWAPRPVAIVSLNADGSVTLAERVAPGNLIAWALRDPTEAVAELRQDLDRSVEKVPNPACALMLSCMGRGAFFHGGSDRELAALRERLPGVPIIGGYSTGQIMPIGEATGHGPQVNGERHNAVVVALLGENT